MRNHWWNIWLLTLASWAPAASSLADNGRTFHNNEPVQTTFTYDKALGSGESYWRMMKVATGAETTLTRTGEVIRRSSLTGMSSEAKTFVFEEELLTRGEPILKAKVERDMQSSAVMSVDSAQGWRSEYAYPQTKADLPLIRTIDVKSRELVSETKDLQLGGDGTFGVVEIHYGNGREVFRSRTRRHAGTGLLIDETVEMGIIDKDYHHYELLIGNWSLR